VVIEGAGNRFLAGAAGTAAKLQIVVAGLPRTAEILVTDGWVSRRYGRKDPAPVLHLRMRAPVPVRWTWELSALGAADVTESSG
jgi:hypothetical protein